MRRISGVIVMFLMSGMGYIHFHPFLPDSKKISVYTRL